MRKIIPVSPPSPRIEHGTLTWCEGDVFTFKLILKLKGAGHPLSDTDGYTFEASFFDVSGKHVKTFAEESTGDSSFTLGFDSETTSLFGKGRYYYDVTVTSPDGRRATVTVRAPAAVL